MAWKSLTTILTMVILAPNFDQSCINQKKSDEELIAYAKKLNVNKMESRLPQEELDTWLKSILRSTTKIEWEINDCGEQTGTEIDRQRDLPFCAGIEAKTKDGGKVILAILIGTDKKGLTKRPGVYYCLFEMNNKTKSINSLYDLSLALNQN